MAMFSPSLKEGGIKQRRDCWAPGKYIFDPSPDEGDTNSDVLVTETGKVIPVHQVPGLIAEILQGQDWRAVNPGVEP